MVMAPGGQQGPQQQRMNMRPGMPMQHSGNRQVLMRQGSHGPQNYQHPGTQMSGSPAHQPQYGGMSPQHQQQGVPQQMRPPSTGAAQSPTPQSPRTPGVGHEPVGHLTFVGNGVP